MGDSTPVSGAFDLNIERVLEHWTVPYALREVIANALDEAAITGTVTPDIFSDVHGAWHIRDHGTGLRYQHLTQKENPAKRKHPDVIGQFGMGLKDALATFDRRGVSVTLRSRHGDITTARRPKAGFADVSTLHAILVPPSDQDLVGTDVVVVGVSGEDIETAKALFLRFSGDQVLETTKFGQVLARRHGSGPGRIYVKGLLVAQEPRFLFSYNITDPTNALRKALNRERSNVGRTAYGDRVKQILTACSTAAVAGPLAADLAEFTTGRQHDELTVWTDVALHACRVLAATEKVVFVTDDQLQEGSSALEHARDDGYRLVLVPNTIARKLGTLLDLEGRPVLDLDTYVETWNDSFSYTFVDAKDLTPAEQAVFAQVRPLFALVGFRLGNSRVRALLISETMRLPAEPGGVDMVLGVWERGEGRIIVRRDQLADLELFAGTLLHELGHALSGERDGSTAFEFELSRLLGIAAAKALEAAHADSPMG